MLVFQMRNVDKTSTVLKQTKNRLKTVITQINKYVRLIPTSD